MRRRTGERLVLGHVKTILHAALGVAAALGLTLARPADAADAGVSLEARADRTTLALGQAVALEIRLEASEAPSSLELGQSTDFRVASRAQSRQSSFTFGPGGASSRQVLVVTLGLAPVRAGELTVPPVVAVVKGKRYETRPIAVKVLPAGAKVPGPPPDPQAGPAPDPRALAGGGSFRGWERDLVLAVQADRREVFLGEQVTVSIWLYSPLGVVEYDRFSPPRHDGFWEEELETPRRIQFQVQNVNGVPTRAYLLQRVALFPTRAGTLELGPAELNVAVQLGGGSIFDPFPEVKRLSRRSVPVTIRVKPLPPGAPAGFDSVNVGKLSLQATASGARVAAGEPVTIRLTASGEGNVRALSLPRLPPIPGAKAFEPTTRDQAAPRGTRFGGTRTLETVLVPERQGELVVPRVSWSWFDPRAGRYEAATTPELRVKVGPGASGGARASAGTNALAAGLRPIRAGAGAALERRSGPPWRSPLFALALAVPPLALAALALADRLRARAGATEVRR
ncbi:BatD family protein, partial [Anaeromyxobacter oryzisoli]|uniref:BatD family protein n=1 Tax=Anaeromyxobacter oryzisoli TaxID=2925408 RepID=UPI001F5AE74E